MNENEIPVISYDDAPRCRVRMIGQAEWQVTIRVLKIGNKFMDENGTRWDFANPVKAPTMRTMTQEECLRWAAENPKALVKHGSTLCLSCGWDYDNEPDGHERSTDWYEKGLKNATWTKFEVEE